MADENGRITTGPEWRMVVTAFTMLAIMVAAGWTIVINENANNKTITDNVTNNYTTKSQHNDLFSRFEREVSRVDALASKVGDEYLTRREFELWKKDHEVVVKDLKHEIQRLQENYISRREFEGVVSERGRQIDQLKKDLEVVRDTEERRHNPQFMSNGK